MIASVQNGGQGLINSFGAGVLTNRMGRNWATGSSGHSGRPASLPAVPPSAAIHHSILFLLTETRRGSRPQQKTQGRQIHDFMPTLTLMAAQMLSRTAMRSSQLVARRGFHTTRPQFSSPYHYPEGPRSNIPFNPTTRFFFLRYWGFMGT